jgi:hypothetical protein
MGAIGNACVRLLRAPELHSDILVVRSDARGIRLIGRQLAGDGRVVRADEPFAPEIGRHIELYSSATDIGRARHGRLSAPLRDFLDLVLAAHGNADDVEERRLGVEGYVRGPSGVAARPRS